MNQVHSVCRNLATTLICGLCDDCCCRGCVAVAARCDACIKTLQSIVDEQRIVHVATRRADVHHNVCGVNLGYACHLLAECLEGSYTRCGVLELILLGHSDCTLDVDVAGLCFVSDCDFGLHKFLVVFLNCHSFFARIGSGLHPAPHRTTPPPRGYTPRPVPRC